MQNKDKLRKKSFKAVIAVDYAGHPCDWKSLRYLSNKYNFKLINDACHSMGSKLNDNFKYATYYSDFLLWPDERPSAEGLLRFFLLDRAFDEVDFALSHRPEALQAPLAGLLRLLSRTESEAHA